MCHYGVVYGIGFYMPWTPKQHRLAEFVKNNPAKAKAEGIGMKPEAAAKMAAEGIKEEPKKKTRSEKISSMYKK